MRHQYSEKWKISSKKNTHNDLKDEKYINMSVKTISLVEGIFGKGFHLK